MEKSIWRAHGFIAFLTIAFFNAFTDLGHKIILHNSLIKQYEEPDLRIYAAILNGLILLPYVMLFTPAGFLSDKFPKHWIIRTSALLAIPVTALITLCYFMGWFWFAFTLTFIMGLQSAIYAPAKFGYIRELVGKQKLGPANSAAQAVIIVAILGGTGVYTLLFETFYQTGESLGEILQSVKVLGFFLMAGATLEFILTWRLLKTAEVDRDLRFEWPKYLRLEYLRTNIHDSWSHEAIRLCIIGISVFWAVGQVVLVTFAPYLKEATGETNTIIAQGLPALSGIGIVIGSIMAGRISRNYIETGIIPLGALGMCVALITIPVLTNYWLIAAMSILFGIAGGLFIVPLNALIQYHAGEGKAGIVIAARNFIENIFMLVFLGASVMLAMQGVSSRTIFWLLAGVVLVGTVYAVSKLPQSLIRYIIQGVLDRRYQMEAQGMQHIPVEGGVLLLGNHVSWLDWAMLQIACPRRIRFVMTRVYYEKWYMRWFFDLFKVIPIGQAGSKDALEKVNEALKAGEVVALFPEGHISHNGHLGVFKSGYERAVQDTDAVIVPFYLRGLWGSRFSYATSKYREISRGGGTVRRIMVGFGKSMPASSPAVEVKQAALETSLHTWNEYIGQLKPLAESFVDTARGNSRRLAVLEARNDFTYARLLAAVLAFAGVLKPLCAKRQNVGVLLPSSAGGVIADLALLINGKTVANLNYTAPLEVVAASAQRAEIEIILTSRLFLKKLEGRGLDLTPLENTARLVYLEDLKEEIPKSTLLSSYLQARWLPAWLLKLLYVTPVKMDSVAAILFSSGSEGTPKGVMLTHANLMANIKQAAAVLNAGDDDVMLNSLPLFHAFGLTVTSLLPLIEAIPMVCQPDPTDARAVGRLCAQYKVTMMFATSTFLRIYTRNRKLHPLMFESLRLIVAGAERLSPEVRAAFWKKFGKTVYEGYGTTETSPVTNCNIPDVLLNYDGQVQTGHKIGTVGLPIPGTSIRIVDPETLQELPAGEAGLILIGGPQVMPGYWQDQEKTEAALVEMDGIRWYKTGDKGKLDDDGFLTILDRYSRFAKIGGEMLSLSAVEGEIIRILDDPEIEVLAVALPDPAKGEQIVLLVSGTEDMDGLRAKVREAGLPPLMQPQQWFAVEAVPKLGTGKADFTGAKKLAAEIFCL